MLIVKWNAGRPGPAAAIKWLSSHVISSLANALGQYLRKVGDVGKNEVISCATDGHGVQAH